MIDTSKDDDEEVQRMREEREAAKRKDEKVCANLTVPQEICPCCLSGISSTLPVTDVHCCNHDRESGSWAVQSTMSGFGRCLEHVSSVSICYCTVTCHVFWELLS